MDLCKKTDSCLICNSKELTKYLALGESAFANSYLTLPNQPEPKAPLDVYFCHNCYLAQLLDIVDRSHLFEDYAYYSSTSPVLVQHFRDYASRLISLFPEQCKKLVVDIGSNDGVLLRPLKEQGCNVLGIDPARNIGKESEFNNIPRFFETALVPEIVSNYGKAGIISANNVLAHTDKLHDIVEAVTQLLDKSGVFVFEFQYLLDLMKHNEFDNTYHEHICYFSLMPILFLLNQHGLYPFDVEHVNTHGGSLRVYAGLMKREPNSKIKQLLRAEREFGLDKLNTYKNFAKQAPINKRLLCSKLTKLKGKTVVGYGAPAKAATLLQYCGIDTKHIKYIVDAASSKQGKYLPGVHIPIVSPEQVRLTPPDYILILAWNYAENIIKKERWFIEQGGKFILPVPVPKIISQQYQFSNR